MLEQGEPKPELRRPPASAQTPLERLRGSVLRYDDPMEPVGVDDWEAAEHWPASDISGAGRLWSNFPLNRSNS